MFYLDAFESLVGPFLLPTSFSSTTTVVSADDDEDELMMMLNCMDCVFVMPSYAFEEDSILSSMHVNIIESGYFKVYVSKL